MKNYNLYKKAKKKLIKRYLEGSKPTQQMDLFISINDFLSHEISEGPNADLGKINYDYQSYENLNNFIRILLKEIKYNKLVCYPDFDIKFDGYIVKNGISYDEHKDEIVMAYDIKKQLDKCIKNDKRFYYFIIIIKGDQFSHANIVVIDLFKKTIERYEPYGKSVLHDENNVFTKKFDNRFTSILRYLNMDNYVYMSPIDLSPQIGLQSVSDAYDGMCITYCLMYIHLRIMNPDVTQSDIISYFLRKSGDEIINMILKYARYVENVLKKNSRAVNIRSDDLYNIKFHNEHKYVVANTNGEKIIYM